MSRVSIDPKQMNGAPCLRGLRIPVATVVSMVAEDMSEEEILLAFPSLEAGDIRAASESYPPPPSSTACRSATAAPPRSKRHRPAEETAGVHGVVFF